jgi:hypothetical protein
MESKARKILSMAIISALYSGAAVASSTDNGVAAPEALGPVVEALVAETAFPSETIDFESDAPGFLPNGWQSADSANVAFSDSVGADLQLADFGNQSDGQALAANTDFDDSQLDMSFTYRLRSLSLDFGNDDPAFSEEGDAAVLAVSSGGELLGASVVVMNRDDIMNQSISVADVGCFDAASFKYDVDPSIGLIEVVDNIEMEYCGGAVLSAGGKTVCTGGNESNGGGDGNGQFSAIEDCDGPAGFWGPDGFTEYDGFLSAEVVLLEDTVVDPPVTPGAAWEFTGTPTAGSTFQYKQKEPNMTLLCEGTVQEGSTATITDLGAVLSGWLYTCYRPDGTVAAEYTVAPQIFVNGTGAGKGRDKDRGSAGDFGGTFVLKRGNVSTYQPE